MRATDLSLLRIPSAPTLTPDGRLVAVTVTRIHLDDNLYRSDLWVAPTDGSAAPSRFTNGPRDFWPRFSPDGRWLAFLRAGEGDDSKPQIHVMPVAGGEPRQLCEHPLGVERFSWSPDSTRIAFVSARHPNREYDQLSDIFVAPSGGGDAVQVTRTTLPVSRPAFSPDGVTIWFCAPSDDEAGRNTGLWSVAADGSTEPRRLTEAERWDVDNFGSGPLELDVEPDAVTTVVLDRGAVHLYRFPTGGGEPRCLVGGRRQVLEHVRAGDVTTAVVSDDLSMGEVVAVRDGRERVLSDFGGRLAREVSLRPMSELTTKSPDGYPVHGWVVKPAGTPPFPVLLMIHGGPFTQYGYRLFDEAQVYAGAGYAVVMGNPRGSCGYGEAHGRAIRFDYGNLDSADLLALLDTALDDPDLDGDQVGVLGGSYGGFMTSWLVGHTNRFSAAISERACNAFDSFEGSSDIGWDFLRVYIGDDPERVKAQSPLTYADRIETPMLLIHSEEDWRCPIEQAQRLFVALKRRHAEVEMLVFPSEGHELSRSGLPSHRVARFEAILEWWDRHLKPRDA